MTGLGDGFILSAVPRRAVKRARLAGALLFLLPLFSTAVQAAPLPPAADDLAGSLLKLAPTLRPEALRAALDSWTSLEGAGQAVKARLAVIDYGLPSTSKRLWVFDLDSRALLFHELVAHGRNTGGNEATSFSNEEGSFKTSLGAFVTTETYTGKHGYSLRLKGMEPARNDRAEARAIVVHGAPYVDEKVAQSLGRLGRSHGCPALRPAIARLLIDTIRDGALLYAWHPSLATNLTASR
jgi:hypothetical protein